jgi:RNA recognition motif. (a.k.a. RRM, RBD, or RNP domain)
MFDIGSRSNPVPHHRTNNWYENSSGNSSSRSIYGNVASAVVQPDSTYEHNSRNNSIDSIENLTNSKSISSTLVPANAHSLTSSLLKKKKSRSGSESPGSVSSRSHSRSPSSSSSTNSTTSNSNASSSSPISGSDHPRNSRNLQSAVSAPVSNSSNSSSSGTQNPAVHSEDNRPLAICVRNLPARSSDTSLKDGLFHEYKKHGKVTWVKVVGQNTDRYALVCFKKPEDVDKALEVSRDKLFFGCKIDVAPYQG